MKKIICLCIISLISSCATKINEETDEVLYHKLNDIYSFKIKEIITDSRCPVDVNCVWQGQVELVISVYENDDFLEDEHLILEGKNLEYNKAIFEKYTFGKKVNGISIYPQKKENEKIELKDYYLEVFVEGQN